MTVRYLLWSYLSPVNLLVLMLVVGMALTFTRHARAGRRLALVATFIFALLLFLPIGVWALAPLEDRFPVPVLAAPPDGILLLTGAIDVRETVRRGQPVFFGFAERLTMTADLARRYPTARILVSGGSNDRSLPSEAAVHRDLLTVLGVDPGRIELDERSINTCESARNVAATIRDAPGRWLLVTSAFHLPRSVACFRAAGLDIVPYPAGYESRSNSLVRLGANLRNLSLALHEWIGLLAYRLMGDTGEIYPAPAAK
jgi:uncharacterized SAM-binding protein YcdF (DUF218 family)